jgi:acetyl esterase/lipase
MTFLELFKADVTIEREIPYRDGDAHGRHVLDIYSPAVDGPPAAVVVYFYGGGWRSGDKRLFEHLGRSYAVRGIVAVVVNYRLTPEVRYPAHADDCADAVGWIYRNIRSHGGDPSRMVISGHSAGAHLAAILGLDRRFLDARQVPASALRGFVVISGSYDLVTHVGETVFTKREFIEETFGSRPEELAAASPITYVRSGLAPFLVVVAENDPEPLREQGRKFAEALRAEGNEALFISVKGRDHFSIVRRFGPSDDPAVTAIVEFVRHVAG